MKRYTIHYKFGEDYLPMSNFDNLKSVGMEINNDPERSPFKVYDNFRREIVEPEVILLACILSEEHQETEV
jgi:hypothetical protein